MSNLVFRALTVSLFGQEMCLVRSDLFHGGRNVFCTVEVAGTVLRRALVGDGWGWGWVSSLVWSELSKNNCLYLFETSETHNTKEDTFDEYLLHSSVKGKI